MTDQGLGPEGPQGRDHLARYRVEDDRVEAEEVREGQLPGRTVEGRPGGTHGESDTELRKNKRRSTMTKGKEMTKKSEAKK